MFGALCFDFHHYISYLSGRAKKKKPRTTNTRRHTPWTRIRHIKMVSILLRGKLRARLSGDPVTKRGLAALELAGLVVGIHPVGDFAIAAGLEVVNKSIIDLSFTPEGNQSCKEEEEEEGQ
jgi:hypothetical protein